MHCLLSIVSKTFFSLCLFVSFLSVLGLAEMELANGTILAAVEQGVDAVQGSKVLSILHALSALVLDTLPVPLTVLVDLTKIFGGTGAGLAATPSLTRTLRKQAVGLDDDRGVDSEATELEDVLADGGGIDVLCEILLVDLLSVLGPDELGAGRAELLAIPAGRLDLALDDVMGDDIQPLAIPRQNTTPHLVSLHRRDFASKRTEHGAQADTKTTLNYVSGRVNNKLVLGIIADNGHGGTQQVGDQVRTRDVEVGEVGRVGLVQVVIGFQGGGVGGGYGGVE